MNKFLILLLFLFIILLISSILRSSGWDDNDLKIKKKIEETCLKSFNITKSLKIKDTIEKIECDNLTLVLLKDEKIKQSTGCSTAYHLCTETKYNYVLTLNGREYPERIPYFLVQNALTILKNNKKDQELDLDSFFKE